MLLIAASCTKNEVVEVNQDGNEIQYSVVANKATKAADIYCNNNMPASFTVYAESSDNKTYINGDVISQQNGSWVNTSGIRFWPNELLLDFYAVVNGTINWNVPAEEGTAPATIDYEVTTTVSDQKDLLYAVKREQEKGATAEATEAVSLNFRHALSQIVFNAKNTNPNLYVEISEVSIVGVSSKGNFTFPITDTDAKKYGAHNGGVTTISDYAGWGTWSSLSESAMYSVGFTKVEVPGDSSVKDLTTANDKPDGEDVTKEFSSKAMLLLPQTVAAWSPAENPTVLEDGNYAKDKGAYFLVDCAIYNIAGDEFDSANDTPLWGTIDGHQEAAIPVAINWEQGKKYIYTFVFGDGGGYDPENPDPDPDDPDPVLIPVTFTVSVDDFVPVDVDPDIDMNPES